MEESLFSLALSESGALDEGIAYVRLEELLF